MKNINVIENFVRGNNSGRTKHLYAEGNKLYNYYTVIAIRKDENIILNNTKYFPTTSKIQNMIRKTTNNITELPEKQIYNIA